MRRPRLSSLQAQIIAIFAFILFILLAGITLADRFLLEYTYVSQKVGVLQMAREDLDILASAEFGVSEPLDSGSEEDANPTLTDLGKSSTRNNLSWVVIDGENTRTVSWGEDSATLQARLFGYVYHLGDEDTGRTKVLKKDDAYVIQKVADSYTGMKYVECWGRLSNASYFLIRTPLESIQESVALSAKFHLIVGLCMGAISILLVCIFARRLTRPIQELTDLSQQMAGLNFEARYESKAGNEMDVLGESFNRMSGELKTAISELKTANLKLQKDIETKNRIDEMRKEFLDNVSHELKTPIALIQGYAEGLKENITDDPQSREFYCEVIMDEASRMNKLVKNLLTLNQLESGKDPVVMERFDLAALIRGALSSMDILIRQKEAHVLFEAEGSVPVWGDEFKVEEVVTNYVSNALNHLSGENQVEIRIRPEEGGKVKLTVFNTGEPIPEEDLPRLWTKFYKVDKARTREYGGSGIGLSIVKAIAEGMHQSYGVKNYENGVEFYFTLDRR